MRLVDTFGKDVPLEELEPWTTFLEGEDGSRTPIISITYGIGFVKVEWQIKEN